MTATIATDAIISRAGGNVGSFLVAGEVLVALRPCANHHSSENNTYAIDQVTECWDWIVHQGQKNVIKIPHEILAEVSPGPEREAPIFDLEARRGNRCGPEEHGEDVDRAKVQRVIQDGYVCIGTLS